MLLPKEYIQLNDLYIKVAGHSSQIDHIIVSVYGIFVIETKNYKGWIYGTDHSEFWTKNMYGNKYRFRNPIKQNYSHVWTLEKLLDIPKNKFIPIVVFLSGAILKCKTRGLVINSFNLKRTILSFRHQVFSENEVKRIIYALYAANNLNKNRKQEHLCSIHKEHAENEFLIKKNICPRCKGILVERYGKFGRFLGCTNYPRCKFTLNL